MVNSTVFSSKLLSLLRWFGLLFQCKRTCCHKIAETKIENISLIYSNKTKN